MKINRLSRDRSPVYTFKNHKKAHNNTYPSDSVASSYNYCIVLVFHVYKCSRISVIEILQMHAAQYVAPTVILDLMVLM